MLHVKRGRVDESRVARALQVCVCVVSAGGFLSRGRPCVCKTEHILVIMHPHAWCLLVVRSLITKHEGLHALD